MRTTMLLLLLSSGNSVCSLQAQELSAVASVDKQEVALDEQLALQIIVQGNISQLKEPELPSLPNFSIYSSGRSQNISIVNGNISSSIIFRYILVPRFVGKTIIGPVRVEQGETAYETQPIEILVTKPALPTAPSTQGLSRPFQQKLQPPSPAQASPSPPTSATAQPSPPVRPQPQTPDLFVKAHLDQPRGFVNEQRILTVAFYAAVPLLGNPEYIAPSFTGFFKEDLPPSPSYSTVYRGRSYSVTEVKTALFSANPGTLQIGRATIRCQVREDAALDPFSPDFFQKFFSRGLLSSQTRELKTEPLTVQAVPLPASGKTPHFSGAVGQYTLQAKVDQKEVSVGNPVHLTVTLQGQGNLNAVGEPQFPSPAELRIYDTATSLNLNKTPQGVSGSKIFTTILIPQRPGPIQLQGIQFSYFDPKNQSYRTLTAPPISLHAAGAPLAASAPSASPGELTVIQEDIRHLKAASSLKTPASPWPWMLHLFPAGVLAASWGLYGWRLRQSKDPVRLRRRQAISLARKKIQTAERHFQHHDPEAALGLLFGAFSEYLAAKLNTSSAALSWKALGDALRKRFPKLPAESLQQIGSLWKELETLRFAPSAVPSQRSGTFEAPVGRDEALHRSGSRTSSEALSYRLRQLLENLERFL
ncbi:MAG: BatD family protein [Elusimicrobia bacterium]|nr:BatD family protein [Elusimicrobiota bacterium]